MIKPNKNETERVGQCLQCGKCCQVYYNYKNMNLIGKIKLRIQAMREGVKWDINAKCANLKKWKAGKYNCKIYFNRPNHCRIYPVFPGELIEGCGYSFRPIAEIPDEKEKKK